MRNNQHRMSRRDKMLLRHNERSYRRMADDAQADCPACGYVPSPPASPEEEAHRLAFIRRWMDAQRAKQARATILRLAPYLRSGYTVSEALAGERARAARVRCELRDADGRVCCSECGEAYDDRQWSEWYSDPDCRPEDDELLCANCAWAGLGA